MLATNDCIHCSLQHFIAANYVAVQFRYVYACKCVCEMHQEASSHAKLFSCKDTGPFIPMHSYMLCVCVCVYSVSVCIRAKSTRLSQPFTAFGHSTCILVYVLCICGTCVFVIVVFSIMCYCYNIVITVVVIVAYAFEYNLIFT